VVSFSAELLQDGGKERQTYHHFYGIRGGGLRIWTLRTNKKLVISLAGAGVSGGGKKERKKKIRTCESHF